MFWSRLSAEVLMMLWSVTRGCCAADSAVRRGGAHAGKQTTKQGQQSGCGRERTRVHDEPPSDNGENTPGV